MKNLTKLIGLSALVATPSVFGMEMTNVTKSASRIALEVGANQVEDADKPTTEVRASYDFAIEDDITIGATAGYWRNEYERQDLKVSTDDTFVGLHTKIYFPLTDTSVVPMVGLGLSSHRISLKTVEDTPADQIDSQTETFADIDGEIAVDAELGFLVPVKESMDIAISAKHRNILDESVQFDQNVYSAGLSYKI